MDEETVASLWLIGSLIGAPLIVFTGAAIFEFFDEIVWFIKRLATYPSRKYKENKIKKCDHTWRKADMSFTEYGPVFIYICRGCDSGKRLYEDEAKVFEKEFMTGWYEKDIEM